MLEPGSAAFDPNRLSQKFPFRIAPTMGQAQCGSEHHLIRHEGGLVHEELQAAAGHLKAAVFRHKYGLLLNNVASPGTWIEVGITNVEAALGSCPLIFYV